MESQKFSTMIGAINQLIADVDTALNGVTCTSDAEKLTISELIDISTNISNIYPKLDKFAAAELYHIIGMEDFSVNQQITFLSSAKELLKRRSIAKPFIFMSTHLKEVNNHICAIDKNSKYKCNIAGITCGNGKWDDRGCCW